MDPVDRRNFSITGNHPAVTGKHLAITEESVLLSITAKTNTGFVVKGVTLDGRPANCSFDYRIVAKRLGVEDVRLRPVPDLAGGK